MCFCSFRNAADELLSGIPDSVFDETVQRTIPPSLVPRLHCVYAQPLKDVHPSFMDTPNTGRHSLLN